MSATRLDMYQGRFESADTDFERVGVDAKRSHDVLEGSCQKGGSSHQRCKSMIDGSKTLIDSMNVGAIRVECHATETRLSS